MFPFQIKVAQLAVKGNFRGIKFREVAIFEGPMGWSEFSPFLEYQNNEAVIWLKAALESAIEAAPAVIRDVIPINATLPNTEVSKVSSILEGFDGCTTIKIKINDFSTDKAIVWQVLRDIPTAKIRLDVNGQWGLAEAITNINKYEQEFGDALDYIEQPCLDTADLKLLKKDVHLKIAVDESIRKGSVKDLTKLHEIADVAIIKWAPSGGIINALKIIKEINLPVVISSALDSSVGISHGLSLAAAVPNLYGACGLGTAALFEKDVTSDALVAIDGKLRIRKVKPELLHEVMAEKSRQKWWQDRVNSVYKVYEKGLMK